MTYLLLFPLRCGSRQNDIRMAEVAGLWGCYYPSPAGRGFPLRNYCPAVEFFASGVSVPVSNGNRVSRLRMIEAVNRDIYYPWSLTKDMIRDFCALSALRVTTREHAPAEIFLVSDLVRSVHAASLFARFSSSRASCTNPSGNSRALE